MRIDNSVVKRWVYDEDITEAEIDRQPTQDVYKRFKDWCDENGERYPLSKTGFVREITATLGNAFVTTRMSKTLGKKVKMFVIGSKGGQKALP